ncbi:MAG TPA: chemotaxis protein CheB [Pilimelia sp.]|nr:chemotaxis protein CheB [Pilimelia sp.]
MEDMSGNRVIVVGASAGGVEALRQLVAGLPEDLTAAVAVVLHVPRAAPSALPRILSRSGALPAAVASDGDSLRPGRIYVAPTDHHLLVTEGRARVTRGPTENGHRPAVDPLFRSAARAYGPRAIGVVLSGSRDDGAAGLAAICRAGGTTLIQDPDDALHPSMPRAAATHTTPDHVLPAHAMGALLAKLARTPVRGESPADPLRDAEVQMAAMAPITSDELPGRPAGLGCPSCGGALWQLEAEPVLRFRCRVGHAWSPETLLEEQAIAVEGALWTALRALEEKSALSRRLADSAAARGRELVRERYRSAADEAEQAGVVLRQIIERGDAIPDGTPSAAL